MHLGPTVRSVLPTEPRAPEPSIESSRKRTKAYLLANKLPLSSGTSHHSYTLHFHHFSFFVIFISVCVSTLTFCINVLYCKLLSPMLGNKRKYNTSSRPEVHNLFAPRAAAYYF